LKRTFDRKAAFPLLLAAAGAILALAAAAPLSGKAGSLLMALLFWTAVVEGCIAAVAAASLVNARWAGSVGNALLSLRPLLLLLSFLLLLLIPFLDVYPWAGKGGIWLRKDFFIGRNLALLLLAYLTAEGFARAFTENGGKKNAFAAAYLFVFVASQTLAAFDLVMSLEYPWYSALFGWYFYLESIYGGFAVGALLHLAAYGRPARAGDPEARSDIKDLAILMLGFSLMWAGLFFAQYLTIWYGNLPEEVSFIAKRVTASPYLELSIAVLFLLSLIPFPLLMSTRAKTNPAVIVAVSASILSGILVERYVFLAPAIRPGFGALAIFFICPLLPFIFAARRAARGISLEA
jgi:hypothetical protein